MVRRVLAVDPDTRWCPAPDCSFAVIAAGCASCPKIKCERPGCNAYFCYHCKAEWHPNQTCDAARAQRSPNVRSSSVSFSQDSQHSMFFIFSSFNLDLYLFAYVFMFRVLQEMILNHVHVVKYLLSKWTMALVIIWCAPCAELNSVGFVWRK